MPTLSPPDIDPQRKALWATTHREITMPARFCIKFLLGARHTCSRKCPRLPEMDHVTLWTTMDGRRERRVLVMQPYGHWSDYHNQTVEMCQPLGLEVRVQPPGNPTGWYMPGSTYFVEISIPTYAPKKEA